MEIDKKEVGRRIKTIRINLKETTAEFAEHFTPPASNSLVSRWERGVNLPNNERIEVISKLGNISVEELLYGNTNISIPLHIDQNEVLAEYVDSKEDIFGQEVKLLAESGIEGLLRLIGRGKGRGDKAVEEYENHRQRIKALKEFGEKYINKHYHDYTYQKYLQDFPNSDPEGFQEFKDNEKKYFKKVLDEHWLSSEIPNKYYMWINESFTDQIKDSLKKIDDKGIEENNRDYYVNEVVQPFLDQAAKDFKEYISDYIDTED